MKFHALILAPVLLLAACETMEGDTPEARLYNATATYGGTVKIALIYESLPRCTMPLTTQARALNLCSEQGAVAAIREGDNAAFTALTILGSGVPTNPGIEALRAAIALDRGRLHSDAS